MFSLFKPLSTMKNLVSANLHLLPLKLRSLNLSTQVLHQSSVNLPTRNTKTNNFIIYCNTQITNHGRNGNISKAESIFHRMPHKTTVSWTAMLTAYAENGLIDKARESFDNMPERNIASYNAMMTAYMKNDRSVDRAYELFEVIPQRNAVSYAAMITGFVKAGMVDKAMDLFRGTPVELRDPVCSNALIKGCLKMGDIQEAVRVFESMKKRDVVSWSMMIDGYCKKGGVAAARELFYKMPERNVVSWTALIDGYMKLGNVGEGFHLFLDMRREGVVKVNATTLTVMFEACSGFDLLWEGIQMHGLVLVMGFEYDVFLGNSMINMYSRFSCPDAACKIFSMMNRKDMVTWNSLISCYVQNDNIEDAYGLFDKMPHKDVVSWTTMISGFFEKGMSERSIELFTMMPVKDDIAWTAIISGFVNNEEYEEACHWFVRMLRQPIRPNALTLSSVLSASAGLATLNQGTQIHSYVLKMKMENDLSIQNSLVSMYSKCGNVVDACHVFTHISKPNIISCNSIIGGLAQNGFGIDALELFKQMQGDGHEPNQVTFLAVLSACAHEGLVEEGWSYFRSMKSLYGFEPSPDHYACMVDILGRAGLLDEAVQLAHSMPFDSHPGVWGALLSASRTYSNINLAELAAQNLIKLQPDNATPYVVLSNLYSISEKKDDEEGIRMTIKSKGLRKSPGCSWITVKDVIHMFQAGDNSHVNFADIRTTLVTIATICDL